MEGTWRWLFPESFEPFFDFYLKKPTVLFAKNENLALENGLCKNLVSIVFNFLWTKKLFEYTTTSDLEGK